MSKLLILFVAFLSLLIAACSSDSGTPASEPSDEYIEAAKDAVWLAKLTLADLPSGWTVDYDQDADDDDEDDDILLTGECAILNGDDPPGQIAKAESDELKGPGGQTVVTETGAFPSAQAAADAMALMAMFGGECSDQLLKVLEEEFRESFSESGATLADLETQQVAVEPLAFPAVADSGGFRIKWSINLRGTLLGGTIDAIFWQEDRLLAGLIYMAPDVDPAEEEEIVLLLADKVRKAAETLPD